MKKSVGFLLGFVACIALGLFSEYLLSTHMDDLSVLARFGWNWSGMETMAGISILAVAFVLIADQLPKHLRVVLAGLLPFVLVWLFGFLRYRWPN